MPEARYVRLRRNIGAAARNIGIRMSRSKYILMLDDDSHPHPDALMRMIRHFETNPRHGVISFKVHLSDGSLESTGCHNVFLGCAAGFRREVFEQAGGYPEEYHYYVEEYDLSFRIIDRGWQVVYSQDCVAYHNRPVKRKIHRIMYYLIRNNLILWAKYFPTHIMVRKIGESITRYRAIAQKEKVMPWFYWGLASGLWRAALSYCFNRHLLNPRTINEVLQTDFLRTKFREKGILRAGQRVGLVGVGKIFSSFMDVCQEFKLDITGIYDPDYRYYRRSRSPFRGLGVRSLDRIGHDRPNVLILCTSDLATQQRLAADLFRKYPDCKIHTFYDEPAAIA